MNITEFAAYAGVSKAAVSRYFNNGYLSEDKKAQIARAAEETGYRPSAQAQTLRTRRTRQIGVVLPRISSESIAREVEGIGRVLGRHNYRLLLVNTANDPDREIEALDMFRHNTVDGILFIATVFKRAHRDILQSIRMPVVILGQRYEGYSGVSHDDYGAAKAVTAHMLQKGRRAPGYLGATMLDKAVGQARRAGFEAALREAGVPLLPDRICTADFSMESGYHQAERLLQKAGRLDCLFCATDTIALGALQYCRARGIAVPDSLMLGAVGDSHAGRMAYVPLTSAHLYYRTAGESAADLLLQMLEKPGLAPRTLELGYELRCRDSTGDTAEEDIWAD